MSGQGSLPSVLVVTNAFPNAADPTLGLYAHDHVESLRSLGFQMDVLYVDRLREGRAAYRRLPELLRTQLEATRPQLVHVMYGGVMADIVSRFVVDTPLLVSFQGTDLLGGRERSPVTRLQRRYGVVASRRAALRASGITVQADVLAAALPARIDRTRVWTVPGGVDLERFAPRDRDESRRQLGWNPDVRHVVFPWSPKRIEKRFPLAQAAVAELSRMGIRTELHAFDSVSHEHVPVWLNASDALLLTSTHEGSPNAVKEALACNVPVVSVDVGDARERLAGLVASSVAAATPAALAAALANAFAARRLDEGRRHVEDLALPRVAERVAAIYDALVDRGPSRRARE